MINTFDVDRNFWLTHPDMRAINPFKELYTSDSSKKKEQSSLMMWFIVLCYDRDSKLFKQPIDEKHRVVGEDYCGDPKFYSKNKLLLDMSIESYLKIQYTPLQRHMATWDKKLDQRTKWLEGLEYDEDDEKIDKAMERTQKVYATYKQIIDDMSKEDAGGLAKGGATPSLLD